ncbi:hypothetical protein J0V14_004804 [Vibrio parahaemolyticus]|nr:hypothetical protein [Vibrio parahaemolyticus]HCH0295948.1 hypothetical protein [Vibrio parahaemolyticus]
MVNLIDKALDPSNESKWAWAVILPLALIAWLLLILDGLVVVAASYQGDPNDDV